MKHSFECSKSGGFGHVLLRPFLQGAHMVPALGSDCDDGWDQEKRTGEGVSWTLLESSWVVQPMKIIL